MSDNRSGQRATPESEGNARSTVISEDRLEALDAIRDAAYAVWMAFLAGTATELQMTLQNLSATFYEKEEANG